MASKKHPSHFSSGTAVDSSSGSPISSTSLKLSTLEMLKKKLVDPRNFFGAIVTLLLIAGIVAAFGLTQLNQDVRQQAALYEGHVCCTFNSGQTYSSSAEDLCRSEGQVVASSYCEDSTPDVLANCSNGMAHGSRGCTTTSSGSSATISCIDGSLSTAVCSPGYGCAGGACVEIIGYEGGDGCDSNADCLGTQYCNFNSRTCEVRTDLNDSCCIGGQVSQMTPGECNAAGGRVGMCPAPSPTSVSVSCYDIYDNCDHILAPDCSESGLYTSSASCASALAAQLDQLNTTNPQEEEDPNLSIPQQLECFTRIPYSNDCVSQSALANGQCAPGEFTTEQACEASYNPLPVECFTRVPYSNDCISQNALVDGTCAPGEFTTVQACEASYNPLPPAPESVASSHLAVNQQQQCYDPDNQCQLYESSLYGTCLPASNASRAGVSDQGACQQLYGLVTQVNISVGSGTLNNFVMSAE